MFHVVHPFSHILSTCSIVECAVAMSHAINPLPHIVVTQWVLGSRDALQIPGMLSMAVLNAIFPLSFVSLVLIVPVHGSHTMPYIVSPVSFVYIP